MGAAMTPVAARTLFFLIVFALALFIALRNADAHEWYDEACCSGHDCAPIPAHAVRWTPQGWSVSLLPGEHPMVRRAISRTFPETAWNAKPSQDRQWHACVLPSTQTIVCVYVPNADG